MSAEYLIGLDQGSSSTKAVAISASGQLLFQTRRALPPALRAGDRLEQDALEILKSVQEVLDETIEALQDSSARPRAIGLSCQRSSCLVWDEATGEPLSPVLSWRDTRGSAFVEEKIAEAPWIFEATGLPLTPYYSASKLRWLKANIAGTPDTAVFGTLAGFLVQRLTNSKQALMDHTAAARTQLMNISTLAWDPKLIELFELGGARLPEIRPALFSFGPVTTAAGELSLSASVGDQQAAMIGLGVTEKADGAINYGTGGFLTVNTGAELRPAPGLMSSILYSTQADRYHLLEGSVNAVGDALEWLRSGLHLFSDYGDLDDLCWQAATEAVVFTGLNGTGSPHWETAISNSVHGMTAESTAADIIRGTVEGIAFFMKQIEEEIRKAGIEAKAFTVSGGLSSLSYLTQFQADILGKQLTITGQPEASAFGAAMLAGLAEGVWSPADIKKMVHRIETVSPRQNPGASRRYRRWKELHRITRLIDDIK